ncbi:MAG: MBL fold metallo-hydrolase [Thermoprotei archaeon]|nr:MBL fold metallo-hydrolase [Thermoprotei archaeon]
MVKVRWLGHACFAVQGENVIVVTDPHNGVDVGLRPPDVKADIVLISHGHYDHADGLEIVSKPDTKVFDSFEGEASHKGVKIIGIKAFHDKSHGEIRGENYIYLFDVDGIRFCHLGDLGHILEDEQLRKMSDVDVLFIPVGGVFTIDAEEAKEVVRLVRPKIAIPMHYKIPKLRLPIGRVKEFLKGLKDVELRNNDTLEVTRENLPLETRIVVLKYRG